MKNLRFPAIILATLVIGFVLLLAASAHSLPEQVASHFDASGNANGWTTRSMFVLLMGGAGLVFPILFMVLFAILQFAPGLLSWIKQPAGEKSPGVTFQYLMRRSFWFASMTLCFIAAVQALIVEANAATPPRLPTTTLLVVVCGFIVGVMFWSGNLLYHVCRGRRSSQPI